MVQVTLVPVQVGHGINEEELSAVRVPHPPVTDGGEMTKERRQLEDKISASII